MDQLLVLNFGEAARSSVWLEAAPILDSKREFLRAVYQAVLSNPRGFLEEYGQIDTNAIKDAIGVPKAREVAQHGRVPEPRSMAPNRTAVWQPAWPGSMIRSVLRRRKT